MPDFASIARRLAARLWPYGALAIGVVTVFWKLVLTTQYTFLDNPDLANQVMPWLQAQIPSLKRGAVLLWTPYEWFGQPLIGQVQPAVVSPFTFLLALAPLRDQFLSIPALHAWFVFLHFVAAVFAYWLLRDVGCREGAAVLGGLVYATAGYCGNTEWPQQLAPGIWAPLVFLFLLRARRGQVPRKSSAWAGAALGASWLCGHHGPSLMLSMAVLGVCVVDLVRPGERVRAAVRMLALFLFAGLVSAVQVLPALEYGKLAKRWTASGGLTWEDKVHVREHEASSLQPPNLVRIVFPGGNALRVDPFVGVAALALAFVAVWGAFHRGEVRLLAVLAACALLYSMARHNALYGPFYALFPMVEKSRSPIVALSVFHFAVAMLAGIGAHLLAERRDAPRVSRLTRTLLIAGGIVLGAYLLHHVFPALPVAGDPRPRMTGLLLLLLGSVCLAWSRGYLRAGSLLALFGALLLVEQSNEVGWNWEHRMDVKEGKFLKPLFATRDIGDFVRALPEPKRIGINDDHLKFTFGDWYRVDAGHAFTASMLTSTNELNWWQDRLVRMYAVNYEVSKAPTRRGQEDVFTGASGLKVFRNPDAFPRAWTVHHVLAAPDEKSARDLVRDGQFDLRTTAVMTERAPQLEKCASEDRVLSIEVRPSWARVRVEMACRGMVVLSDNWYPGWRAMVDRKPAALLRANTVLRAVAVDTGPHEVMFRYRPWSVYLGLIACAAGLLAALALQLLRESVVR